MKEEKIRVLALLPTEYAKIVTIDNTLEAMQQFVGGLIECLPMDDPEADIVLVCNDEGKLLQLPPNRWLWGGQDLLVGPAFYRRRGRGGQPVFFVRCHVRKVHKPV